MEQLNKIKEALINAGKKVLIQITDDIVKIIVGDSAGSSYSGLEKRGITDIWNQVKNAVKSAAEKVQDYLNDKMDVLKPKIMDALANAKADLNGFKEVVIEGSKKLYVKATAKGVEIIADLKGVWAEVEAALQDAQAKADEFIKAKIEEYKPQIIEALNKFQEDVEDYKDFVIEESKKIYVRINKFGVQVVEDANAVWDKVEAAVKDFVANWDIKAEIEKYKPQIIAALNKFRDDVEDYKDFVIDEAKKIHVRIDKFRVQIMEDANDVYEKARAAAEKLNGDVRDYVLAKIEELKPQVIEGLNKAKTVVIDGAKKIYLEIKVDFLSSINYNGLGFVQSFDDLGFVFLDFCNDVVLDISLQLLGGSSGFLVDIIGIFHDLDTEFVDADMDFLGFIDNEIFVVFNIITEFVQGGDDLWLVFLNLGFDVPVSDEVLDSGLNFVPDSIGIFDNLDSEFVDTNVDFL